MSYRNQTRGGYRHHTDPTSSGYYKGSQNVRYRTRGGPSGRGRGNRRPTDDVDSLTVSISDNLTTDTSVRNFRGRVVNSTHRGGGGFGGPRPVGLFNKHTNQSQARQNQTGWWRVSIPKAGHIGKDRVMSILKVHTSRQFQPYHYFIDRDTNMGVFFVNSREEADMLKRANGKLSAQNSETLSIMVGRAAFPAPYLDEDLIRHFRDFIRTRYDMNTNALNLSNLADDEALSAVGIYPQLNKQQFVRDLINIINDNIPMTRFLDLSQNSITNLYEFRNLKLPHLEQLNLSLNQLRAVDELQYLKNLPLLSNLYLRENVLQQSSKNNDDLISAIRQKLPQLKRLDDNELPPTIRFATDIDIIQLPKSKPHYVPEELQSFLGRFIQEYYQLFDIRGRDSLHSCYHEKCMFSLCIATPPDSCGIQTRQYKYGPQIYDSRNLQKVVNDSKRLELLKYGKQTVLDYLRIKFPTTKHDPNSFHVDVISSSGSTAIFTINGLYKEIDAVGGSIRCFQRTFTMVQSANGVHIICDHLLVVNATNDQVVKMNKSVAPPPSAQTSQPSSSQIPQSMSMDQHQLSIQNQDPNRQQMILKFSTESGMNQHFSTLCLEEHNWDYNKAAQVFTQLQNENKIPSAAFIKS